jgi:hypothetical protein
MHFLTFQQNSSAALNHAEYVTTPLIFIHHHLFNLAAFELGFQSLFTMQPFLFGIAPPSPMCWLTLPSFYYFLF